MSAVAAITSQLEMIFSDPARKMSREQKDTIFSSCLSLLQGREQDLSKLSKKDRKEIIARRRWRVAADCPKFVSRTFKMADFARQAIRPLSQATQQVLMICVSTCRASSCKNATAKQVLTQCPLSDKHICIGCSGRCAECKTWFCAGNINKCANLSCQKRICDNCTSECFIIANDHYGKHYCEECHSKIEDKFRPQKRRRVGK